MRLLRSRKHTVELMQEDYDTYGEDSFVSKTVGTYSEDVGRWKEIFIMKMLRSQDPRYGYNYMDKSGNSECAVDAKWRPPYYKWRYHKKKTGRQIQEQDCKTFLDRLDYLKTLWSINNLELSTMAGIPYTTIASFYDKGYENIKWKTLNRICKFFGVTAEYMMCESEI